MNDKTKAKLKRGEYILTEKRHAKSELWKSFREIQDAATKEKNCRCSVRKMPFCFKLLRQKCGTTHLSRHCCKFSAGQSYMEKHLHQSSLCRPVPQKVKYEVSHYVARTSDPLTL
jgi:hypothetical protein